MSDNIRLKDEPRGVWAESQSNLVRSKHGHQGRTIYVQPYVEQVLDSLRQDLASKSYKDPELFTIVSGYRSPETQAELFAKAVKKYGSEAEARKWVAKVSPHNTGAAVDFYLGYSTDSENVNALFASQPYKDLASLAYHKYKMAPYDKEPWHWECGEACRQNIMQMQRQPRQGSASPVAQNQPSVVPKDFKAVAMTQNLPPKNASDASKSKKKQGLDSTTISLLAVGGIAVIGLAGFAILKRNKSKKRKKA